MKWDEEYNSVYLSEGRRVGGDQLEVPQVVVDLQARLMTFQVEFLRPVRELLHEEREVSARE